MSTETQTYQLILELKNELTQNLKDIQQVLKDTAKAGGDTKKSVKDTEEATKSFAGRIKESMQPMRDFARMMREVMMFGGFAIVARQIAAALGDMQMQYEKLNPEAAKAAGSLTNWNAAMIGMKANVGGAIDQVLNPLRAWFISLVDPMFQATQRLKDFNTWTDAIIKMYASQEFLGAMKYAEALKAQTRAQDEYNSALGKQVVIQLALNRARQAVKTANESGWLGLNGLPLGPTAAQLQAVTTAENALKVNSEIIRNSQIDARVIADWIKANPDGLPVKITKDETPTAAAKLPMRMEEAAVGPRGRSFGPSTAKLPMRMEEAQIFMDAWDMVRADIVPTEMVSDIQNISNFSYDQLAAMKQNNKLSEDMVENLKQLKDTAFQRASLAFDNPSAALGGVLDVAGIASKGDIGAFIASAGAGIAELVSSMVAMIPVIFAIIAIMDIFTAMMDILQPSIDSVWQPFADLFKLIGDMLGTLLLPIFTALEPVISAVCDVLGGILYPIFLALKPVFEILGYVLKVVLTPVILIFRIVADIINAFLYVINLIIIAWGGTAIDKIKVPEFPTFHQGGVAQDDMVALLKKGEIVTNPYSGRGYVAGGGGESQSMPDPIYAITGKFAGRLVKLGLAEMRA